MDDLLEAHGAGMTLRPWPEEPRSAEAGSLTVEAVVLVPVVVLFALVSLALGRVEMAKEQVVAAARAGVEAASVMPDPASAGAAASAAAVPAVFGRAHSCAKLSVSTHTSDFVPGGAVSVTVSCRVSLADLLLPGLPGSTVITASESAPIDPYRVVS